MLDANYLPRQRQELFWQDSRCTVGDVM